MFKFGIWWPIDSIEWEYRESNNEVDYHTYIEYVLSMCSEYAGWFFDKDIIDGPLGQEDGSFIIKGFSDNYKQTSTYDLCFPDSFIPEED